MKSVIHFNNCNLDDQDIAYLSNVNKDTHTFFGFDGIVTICKVVYVYDGDTIDIVFKWNNMFLKHRCRFFGINCPEIKPLLSKPNRDDEILRAKQSRDYIINRMLNENLFKVKFVKYEKYGRLLSVFYDNSISYDDAINDVSNERSINKEMIDNNLAIEYMC